MSASGGEVAGTAWCCAVGPGAISSLRTRREMPVGVSENSQAGCTTHQHDIAPVETAIATMFKSSEQIEPFGDGAVLIVHCHHPLRIFWDVLRCSLGAHVALYVQVVADPCA